MKLTESQKLAVHTVDGNTLINAGSGSGKTQVTTARIANLIANEGASPESILALSFTKEASENMRDRLGKVIGKKRAKDVELSTFHSFAYRVMRSRFPHMYTNKTIIQQWWRMSKLYDIVSKPQNGNPIGLGMCIKAGELSSFISYQKANMIKGGMEVMIDDNVSYVQFETRERLQLAFDTYCEHVRNARLIEFDDMLVDFYYKLKEDANLAEDLRDKYKYIMVDEFQDTNTINLEILRIISDNNLFVVGDFRQGIYGFINANIDNILDFSEKFDDVKVIELQDNFRSTGNIVGFINSIIDVAPVEKYKKFGNQVPARKEDGDKVNITLYNSDKAEAVGIVEKVEMLVDEEEYSYNDFAVLLRTNAQIGEYESVFAEAKIPVDVSSGKSFFDRKDIADLLAYAQHAIDAGDDMSIRRIINSPNRFISKAMISSIDEFAYNNNITFERACHQMDVGRARTNVNNLLSTFGQLRDKGNMNASKFLREIYKLTHFKDHIAKSASTFSEVLLREDSIDRLFDMSKKFTSIKAFLGHVSIIKQNSGKNKNGVKLMTVHGSKGLEFKHVFVPSATSENYPHQMSQCEEEERRLFYVACSRAMDCMDVSVPVYGKGGAMFEPSPFLKDVIGEQLTNERRKVLTGSPVAQFEFTNANLAVV